MSVFKAPKLDHDPYGGCMPVGELLEVTFLRCFVFCNWGASSQVIALVQETRGFCRAVLRAAKQTRRAADAPLLVSIVARPPPRRGWTCDDPFCRSWAVSLMGTYQTLSCRGF